MRETVFTVLLLVLVVCSTLLGQGQHPAVTAFEDQVLQARPLDLSAVRLLAGPLKHAQELDAKYLLELEPDRMMAGYRLRAGLEPKAEGYGGWDSIEGRQLTGHIAGHYLSAVSLMWAATGDPRFKERADYLVAEMKVVQDKRGNGYVGALANNEGTDAVELFRQVSRGDIRSGGFDLNGMWSPWYTLHKTYAGLRDAYRYTGNRTALEVEIKFAQWAESVLAPMTDAQVQRMLNTEFGGMNEVLVDLYADTGDARWLDLSYKFEHDSFIEPLQRHQDVLPGKHGNTQVPKLLGSADRFAYTGTGGDLIGAGFFWDRVADHHSFATGGHGKDEYFGPADELNDFVDGRTAESCNVYNMLKLTRRLFALHPDAHYADFHERALFNHILASIDPEDGRTCYMVPVGRGVQHEYQDMFHSFTCCVGTGLESHALHADGIYYESPGKLWVNLYVPSAAKWASAQAEVRAETDFPEGEAATLTLTLEEPRAFTLALRRPYWVGAGFAVKVNGQTVSQDVIDPMHGVPESGRRLADSEARPVGSYVELTRTWKSGDIVEVTLPKTLRLEPVPDNPRRATIMWGPLVLAGDLGPERRRGRDRGERVEVPVFVAAERAVSEWVKPVPGEPGTFRTADVGRIPDAVDRPRDVELVPFYRLHRRTYATYWELFTPTEWEQEKAAYAAEQERQRKLEQATVAYAQPGEMQPERNFNFQGGDDARPTRVEGRPGRRARSWFSFDMPVDADHPMALVVTYYSTERRRGPAQFEILVDGQQIAEQEVGRSEPSRFFDVEYPIPAPLVAGKENVTVRFQAKEDSSVAGVFGLRMIRADADR